jgi:CxxC-x17-CxxC domain-containing protein
MRSFNKGSKFSKRDSGRSDGRSFGRPSGGGRFGGRDSGRSSSRGPSESFEATCDKCGKKCDLPFKPTGNKPVYCRDCFRSASGGKPNNFERSSPRDRDNFEPQARANPSSDDLEKINRKLDKIMRALKIE